MTVGEQLPEASPEGARKFLRDNLGMAAQALSHSIPCSTAHGSRRLRQSLPVHTRRTQRAAAPQCLAFVTGSDGFSGGSSLLSQAASVVGLGLAAWVAARAVDGQVCYRNVNACDACTRS